MAYELVISDLGGVVVEFNADQLVHQLAQVVGRSFEEVQGAVYDKELLLPFELGQIGPQAYYDGLRRRLQIPWGYEQFAAFWNNIFTEQRDVTALMRALSRHRRFMALSNTNALHLAHIKAQFPSLSFFEAWVASCDVGCRKPDPDIYRLALKRADVSAERAVYVDDRPEMVEGGGAVGLTAIRFESARQLEQDLRALGVE